MSIIDWPKAERPREKLLAHGASSLSDAEILALFIRTGIRGKTALDLARDWLIHFDGLRGLLDADQGTLQKLPGLGPAKYAELRAALELGQRHHAITLSRQDVFSTPETTRRFLTTRLRPKRNEVFAVLFLDSQNRLIRYEELFSGTVDSCTVHPRVVAEHALQLRATAVILAHNHPSGHCEPSAADYQLTEQMRSALALLDIRVLDHFVIGEGPPISFAERGLL
jgi:DNA repair protein RadC